MMQDAIDSGWIRTIIFLLAWLIIIVPLLKKKPSQKQEKEPGELEVPSSLESQEALEKQIEEPKPQAPPQFKAMPLRVRQKLDEKYTYLPKLENTSQMAAEKKPSGAVQSEADERVIQSMNRSTSSKQVKKKLSPLGQIISTLPNKKALIISQELMEKPRCMRPYEY